MLQRKNKVRKLINDFQFWKVRIDIFFLIPPTKYS